MNLTQFELVIHACRPRRLFHANHAVHLKSSHVTTYIYLAVRLFQMQPRSLGDRSKVVPLWPSCRLSLYGPWKIWTNHNSSSLYQILTILQSRINEIFFILILYIYIYIHKQIISNINHESNETNHFWYCE